MPPKKGWVFRRHWSFSPKFSGLNPDIICISMPGSCQSLFSSCSIVQTCGTPVSFHIDNQMAVSCISRQGSSQSEVLLAISEAIFDLAYLCQLLLSAHYLSGHQNIWADPLFRSAESNVEWRLLPQEFRSLTTWFSLPRNDLFATPTLQLLLLYFTRYSHTEAGDPDALTVQ